MAADLGLNITGEGTPIVMVMGRNASGRVWDAHQVPGLVARGWRVATFDNRGSGGNINPDQQFHFNDLVQDVLTIIDQHLGEPAFLVGTSLGSRIVLEAARQRSDLVLWCRCCSRPHAPHAPADCTVERTRGGHGCSVYRRPRLPRRNHRNAQFVPQHPA